MSYKVPLFTWIILQLLARSVAAQKSSGEGIHSAPGMPLTVGHRVTTPYVPARVVAPVIMPRFWHETDSVARQSGYVRLYLYVQQHVDTPKNLRQKTAEDLDFRGKFTFQLLIHPDGSVAAPRLIKRQLVAAETLYSPGFVAALEQEAAQGLGALRFTPSGAASDTLTVPISFDLR